ncbi:MAG TPA: dephospho-CoA kinase [Candidatus Limnocylindrales bacterium]|nr:dephospho-CoA kinase [Candidatus Limnocylindrales bacterium]
MLKVGLTGGIASGKTEVAAMLRDRDCPVLEMDPLGHEMLEPGQDAYKEVVREFGPEILIAGDKVNRAKLGEIVFRDPAKRARLNAILHPRILDVVTKWFAALDTPGGPEVAVVVAALIVESGYQKQLDKLIVCWCKPEQQIHRLVERGFTEEQARQRIASQMPMDEKRKYADEVIDCSGTLEATEKQVGAALARLKAVGTAGRNIR